MKDTLVTFDTANLAKEKGFAEPCHYAYGKNGESAVSFYEYFYEYSRHKIKNGDNFNFYKGTYRNISAPTQSLLQKWLRDKFNIHIEITWVDTLSDIYVYHISTTNNAIRPDSVFYHSYEESLEEGLKEGLKLI